MPDCDKISGTNTLPATRNRSRPITEFMHMLRLHNMVRMHRVIHIVPDYIVRCMWPPHGCMGTCTTWHASPGDTNLCLPACPSYHGLPCPHDLRGRDPHLCRGRLGRPCPGLRRPRLLQRDPPQSQLAASGLKLHAHSDCALRSQQYQCQNTRRSRIPLAFLSLCRPPFYKHGGLSSESSSI